LNLGSGVEATVCAPVTGDSVAVVGENRKLLVFPLAELPEMARGRGVIMQKYKDGGLSDAKTFEMKAGLDWEAGAGRTRVETKLLAWIGKRAQAGRLPPNGFPKANKFSR
jgi:topoisomerase-4 subunit A